jgi:hypothetical protein
MRQRKTRAEQVARARAPNFSLTPFGDALERAIDQP